MRFLYASRALIVAAPLLAHCAQSIELPDSAWTPPRDAGSDAARVDAPISDVEIPPRDPMTPTVAITAPADGASISAARANVLGRARSGAGVAAVEVRVGPNAPRLAMTANGFAAWSLDSAFPFGEFTIAGALNTPWRVPVLTRGGGARNSSQGITAAVTSERAPRAAAARA
jgi:hypothetical protein